jgi:Na+-transporting NADH:ubiquinone oxidoreductase subunit NqrF
MNYSGELSTGPVSSKKLKIDAQFIEFGDKKIATASITSYLYSQTVNKVNGIRLSTSFEFYLKDENEAVFKIQFVGVAGSTANMEKQYSKIVDCLGKLIGNRILNSLYKGLLEGRVQTVCNDCKIQPRGFVIINKRLFRKDTEQLVSWENIDFQFSAFAGGFLKIRSLAEDKASVEFNMSNTYNAWVLYDLLRWLFADSDRIAKIYEANGIAY